MLATHTAALLGGSQGDGLPRQTPGIRTAPGGNTPWSVAPQKLNYTFYKIRRRI